MIKRQLLTTIPDSSSPLTIANHLESKLKKESDRRVTILVIQDQMTHHLNNHTSRIVTTTRMSIIQKMSNPIDQRNLSME